MQSITPIFLLSLPRSGSTLLQRLLAVDDGIATATEPWLLLPLLYARRDSGSFTEYSHWRSVIAHDDFVRSLPNGKEDDRRELAEYVRRLYRKAAGDEAVFFLDKTPRYSLIADELITLFPDAQFIYLWRNPIAAAASMMQTWAGGRWNLDDYRVDFYRGLPLMIDTFQAHPQRVCAVQYERLLADPATELARVLGALGRPFDAAVIDRFTSVRLEGRFGDQTGVRSYPSLSREPLEKWKTTMGNVIRRRWARRYLTWLGRERLAVMGYDLDTLLQELKCVPRSGRYLLSDACRHGYGVFNAATEWDICRAKRTRRQAGQPHTSHS